MKAFQASKSDFRWKAPADFEGEVSFRFSTVIEYDKYWVNVNGPKIRVSRSAPEAAEDQTSSTEAPETAKTAESPIVFPASATDPAEEDPAAQDPVTAQTTQSTTTDNQRFGF